jgi:photosystem II stability/assembly factor-like uncharacterized protein
MQKGAHWIWIVVMLLSQGCRKDRLALPWERVSLGTHYDLTCMVADSTGRMWIAGGDVWRYGLILHTEDAGATWTQVVESEKQFLDMQLTTGGLLACGVDVHLWHSEEGSLWASHYTNRWNVHRGVAAFTPTRWISVGGHAFDDGFMYIHDDHDAEEHYWAHTNRIDAVQVLDSEVAIAAGYGAVYRTEDQGRSWQLLDVRGDYYTGMDFPTRDTGYMVGYGGSILKSTDSGSTWRTIRTGGQFNVSGPAFRYIHFRDTQTGIAAGERGVAWLTRDGGHSWQELSGLPGRVDWHTALITDQEVWLAGTGGHCYRALLP